MGRQFAAFLFDMDGTVLNSIGVAERVWGAWARQQGLDVAAFLASLPRQRFEDASAGIAAAQAAGASVVVISATHAIETTHITLADYHHTRVVADDEGLAVVRSA